MNRKEIITADLLARVQWGVKCETTKWQNNGQGKPMSKAVGKLIGYSERTGYEVVFNEDDFAEDFDKVKPLLFSSLTEPITVAGETFVPIFKALEEEFGEDEYEMTFIGSIWQVRDPSDSEEVLLESMGGDNYYQYFPNWFIEKLQKWHVNYRLLPGEYIHATNEYA